MNARLKIIPGNIVPARELGITDEPGLDMAQATWPASRPVAFSLLAQRVHARPPCDAETVCGHSPAPVPDKVAAPSAFCPNAEGPRQTRR